MTYTHVPRRCNLEGNKKYVGYPVKTPDGNCGTILDYDETTDTYDVKLESGKSGRYTPSDLKLIPLSDPDEAEDEAECEPGGLEDCEPGGTEDW
jgi:hypothetical protein